MDVFAQFLKLRSNKVKHDAGVWMMGSSEDALRTRQDEVQRLLGQCLLGLQAYERLMKAIVAHHDISGSLPSLERTEAGRAAVLGRKTLGTLVNELIESFLTTDGMASSSAASPEPFENDATFGFRIQLGMSDNEFARTASGLKELVLLRNGLVHHFLERHDLGDLNGCSEAEAELIEASGRIKLHFDDLRQWSEVLHRTRLQVAEFIMSDAFLNSLADRNISWPVSAIVNALREASAELALDGWTPVADAGKWVAARYPEELPANYGCRTWRQVLHQSGVFELRYFQTDGLRRAWYRVKSHARNS